VKEKKYDMPDLNSMVEEDATEYGHSEAVQTERRRKAILLTDMEKFHLFSKMLRRGIMFKNATITHKPFPTKKD
jgi:hypothetical protein